MRKYLTIRRYFLGLALCTVGAVGAAQNLNLARNENATEQAIAASLLTDIYKRAGLTASIAPLPGARANAMTLSGEKDGEVARIQAYATRNPSLTKVEPAYYHLTTTAFARADSGIVIASRDDLKKYKVGYVRGIAHAEAATEGVPNVQVVDSYDQLYLMLEAGRLEVIIDAGANGPYVVKKLKLKNIRVAGGLARLELFNILGPANKHLAPKIGSTIKALADSGELAKMVRHHEEEFLKSNVAP
jgi:polar amino acid transport system substrate-binding protein